MTPTTTETIMKLTITPASPNLFTTILTFNQQNPITSQEKNNYRKQN